MFTKEYMMLSISLKWFEINTTVKIKILKRVIIYRLSAFLVIFS